jgi:biotin transport system substrate-specific component
MNAKTIAKIAIFTALTAICAQLSIPTPLSSAPFSLSIFGVFLAGALLDEKSAVFSQIVYLLIGAVGLPVFSMFRGGLGMLVGATGGFLIAYPFMAFITSFCSRRLKGRIEKDWLRLMISTCASLPVCYIFGAAGMMVFLGLSLKSALMAGVVPFIAVDLLKAVLCSLLAARLQPIVAKFG